MKVELDINPKNKFLKKILNKGDQMENIEDTKIMNPIEDYNKAKTNVGDYISDHPWIIGVTLIGVYALGYSQGKSKAVQNFLTMAVNNH